MLHWRHSLSGIKYDGFSTRTLVDLLAGSSRLSSLFLFHSNNDAVKYSLVNCVCVRSTALGGFSTSGLLHRVGPSLLSSTLVYISF